LRENPRGKAKEHRSRWDFTGSKNIGEMDPRAKKERKGDTSSTEKRGGPGYRQGGGGGTALSSDAASQGKKTFRKRQLNKALERGPAKD